MPDGVDLYGVLVLVDAVDDPVGPAPRGVVTVKGLIKWLADAVRVCSERPVDRLHGRGSDVERRVLVQVTPGLPGENDDVRSFGLWSGGLRSPFMMSRGAAPARRGPARRRTYRRRRSLRGTAAGRRVPRRR